ncbi:unnamed protein product [Nesidiocoris tenuis]|uniref:Carboxypeptidase n=2 Tax=Nesidiocoris tenuis TaxID=355587 RepID=A0ABN7ADE5_9HEMI|nr:Carboxypeptidase [Nesidiocoris tenuis]CAB0000118.1 unnamed protein product [Nesidiocoris tenuis]
MELEYFAFLFSFFVRFQSCAGLGLNFYPNLSPCNPTGPVGEPLFLTPYIESGRAQEGRRASLVPPLLDDVKSYSGYLTINKSSGSNLFFWYFPAESQSKDAPVALWLQGGPGGSSMFGLFTETGPLEIKLDLSLRRRKYSWTNDFHMLYIDNPVGTGFSFTKDPKAYVTNEEEVGRDLYLALVQFFQLFPEIRRNDFYITGESYAGKYIPALAYAIHANNPSAGVKMNLKGFAIGNGLVDPENMMKYGDYLWEHGLVDREGLARFHAVENSIVDAIRSERFADAAAGFEKVFRLVVETTGNVDMYDYLIDGEDEIKDTIIGKFLCQAKVRKSIHVGNLTYNDGSTVASMLREDMMKSVKPWFQVLLEHYRVLLYNGQLDIVVAYPLTVRFVEKLEWSGKDEYLKAKRKIWTAGGKVAGYSKTAKNFTEILVRDAGHMVPSDQPLFAYDMISKFFKNVPF